VDNTAQAQSGALKVMGIRRQHVLQGAPASKLAATSWVTQLVAIEGRPGFSDDQAYRAMDFLLETLDEIAAELFASVAHLLNLDLDIVFVDTTSGIWITTVDELAQSRHLAET
jgi:hypothetical protein